MKRAFEQVRTFHKASRQKDQTTPLIPNMDDQTRSLLKVIAQQLTTAVADLDSHGSGVVALRARLMLEELGETISSMADGGIVKAADGLADLAYVTVGSAVAFGIPLPEVWEEVHRTNMAKFPLCTRCSGTGVIRDSSPPQWVIDHCYACDRTGYQCILDKDGKVIKPEGWRPPDIAAILT